VILFCFFLFGFCGGIFHGWLTLSVYHYIPLFSFPSTPLILYYLFGILMKKWVIGEVNMLLEHNISNSNQFKLGD